MRLLAQDVAIRISPIYSTFVSGQLVCVLLCVGHAVPVAVSLTASGVRVCVAPMERHGVRVGEAVAVVVAVGVPVGGPPTARPRTRPLSRSAMTSRPPWAATPVAPRSMDCAAVASPSPASPADPLPATVVTTPAGVTMRTAWLPKSATYTSPVATSTATPSGYDSRALVALPPSPA